MKSDKRDKALASMQFIDINSPTAMDELVDAIGAKPGDIIEVTSTPTDRPANWPKPGIPPSTAQEWNSLREMTVASLREMGCGSWDGRLMLFPREWYSRVPVGFPIEYISGDVNAFIPGHTDNDVRLGCLSFGVPAIDGQVVVE